MKKRGEIHMDTTVYLTLHQYNGYRDRITLLQSQEAGWRGVLLKEETFLKLFIWFVSEMIDH